MTVVHYLNQFFAGRGGEEAADAEPFRIDGPVGPGNALAAAGITPDTTIGCGDDFFGQARGGGGAVAARVDRRAAAGRPDLRPVVRIGAIRVRVRRRGSRGRSTRHPGRGSHDARFARRARERRRRLHRAHRFERGEHADRAAHDRVAGEPARGGRTGGRSRRGGVPPPRAARERARGSLRRRARGRPPDVQARKARSEPRSSRPTAGSRSRRRSWIRRR